ncbi:hypothetical protein N4807_14100, partial [Enterococcus faecalis]
GIVPSKRIRPTTLTNHTTHFLPPIFVIFYGYVSLLNDTIFWRIRLISEEVAFVQLIILRYS